MKIGRWMAIILVCGLCCLAGFTPDAKAQKRPVMAIPSSVPAPLDPADEAKYLKSYRLGGIQIMAGFMPEQAEYVWGEPIHYFQMIVKNTGSQTFSFMEGGDYRGGRSASYQLSAVDAAGKPVEAPQLDKWSGKIGFLKVEPGGVFRKMLPAELRLHFPGPGVYTITGMRTFVLGNDFNDPALHNLPTSNTFTLTIHPYTPERMAAAVERLGRRIRAHGEIAPRAPDATEPEGWTLANQQWRDLAELAEIKDPAARDQLIALTRQAPVTLRAGALRSLGSFTDKPAMDVVLAALLDPEAEIRVAAATAMGSMKTGAAVSALLADLPNAQPETAGAILVALGHTQSPQALPVLTRALAAKDARRRGAVDGLVAFGGDPAIKALVGCTQDKDMDFREYVVKQLAQALRQPINPQWLVPVIKSRKGVRRIGEAPTLLRLYCGPRAVPALLSCLDYADPSIRSDYNWDLIENQEPCEGGMRIPWIHDWNRKGNKGTPSEIERNRKTLQALKAWVTDYDHNRQHETTQSLAQLAWPEMERLYGEPVDGWQLMLFIKQRVWPAGMPQPIELRLRGERYGSIELKGVPDPLEVEVNGKWYHRQPPLTGPTEGIKGYGSSFNTLMLDENWKSIEKGRPLRLSAGTYTVRVRLSLQPAAKRTGLVMSKPVTFRILGER